MRRLGAQHDLARAVLDAHGVRDAAERLLSLTPDERLTVLEDLIETVASARVVGDGAP